MDSGVWQAIAEGVAAVLALVAIAYTWRRGKTEDTRARESDQRVDEANRIAAEALELARTAERRAANAENSARESTDVAWHPEWAAREGRLAMRNVGTDLAQEVRLVVQDLDPDRDYDTEQVRVEQTWPSIGPGDGIAVDISDIVRYHRFVHGSLTGMDGKATVQVRVTWRSSTGRPFVHELPSFTV